MRDPVGLPNRAYAVVSTVSPAWLGGIVGNQDRNALRSVYLTFSVTEAESKVADLQHEVFKALGKDSARQETASYVQRMLDYRASIGIVVLRTEEITQALTHG